MTPVGTTLRTPWGETLVVVERESAGQYLGRRTVELIERHGGVPGFQHSTAHRCAALGAPEGDEARQMAVSRARMRRPIRKGREHR